MPLTENRTTFTFNHKDQQDEYGASVGDYQVVQANFDSRAEQNLNDINNIKDSLRLDYATKDEITTNRKLSTNGNFTGTWNGVTMTAAEPGLSSAFNAHLAETTHYNLLHYMQGGKTAIQAMTEIISEINAGTTTNTTIYIPAGTYDFTTISAPFIILKDNVQILGEGKCGSIINVYQNKLFQWGNDTVLTTGGGITNIKFVASSAPLSSQCCVYLYWAASLMFDVQIYNINQFLIMTPTTTATNYSTGCSVVINGMKYNGGSSLCLLNKGAGFWLKGNTYVGGVTTVSHGSTMSSAVGCDLLFIAGAFDSIFVSGLHERYYRGITGTATSGVVIQNINTDAWFDYTRFSCILMATTGGVVSGVHIKDGSWLCSWEYDAIQFNCQSGSIQDINIINSKIPIAGSVGINCNNVSRLNILNNLFSGIGQSSATNAGIYINGTGNKVTVKGNRLIDGTPDGLTWGTAPYIQIASGIDNLILEDNDAYGIIVGAFATASKKRTCKNNIMSAIGTEMNYSGARTDIFPLPASGATFTNVYPYEFEIFMYGGTIQDIVKNGYQICVGSPVSFTCFVKPGETFTMGYTVAPTWRAFVSP